MTGLSENFEKNQKEFIGHIFNIKGYSKGTCYGYNSDLGIWSCWLRENHLDWREVTFHHVEQFSAWQMRQRNIKPHIINRRASCLSSFYKWAMRNKVVENDPVALAEKPRRPDRIPVYLDEEELERFKIALTRVDDIPENIFGQRIEHIIEIRKRYEILFGLLLNSGIRISEALTLKFSDVRSVDGILKSIQVIGKGDKQRQIPLPEAFGQAFGVWLGKRTGEFNHFIFEKEQGGKPPTAHAVRAYLQKVLKKAGIEKKVTPHKMRHTYATKLLSSGAQLVDIQALLGHVNLATTQIYSHVTEERLASVVSGL